MLYFLWGCSTKAFLMVCQCVSRFLFLVDVITVYELQCSPLTSQMHDESKNVFPSSRWTTNLLSSAVGFPSPLSPLNVAAFRALNGPSVRGEQDNLLLLFGSLSASVAGEPWVVSLHPAWGKKEAGACRTARGKCGGSLLRTAPTTEPTHSCFGLYMHQKAGTVICSVRLFPLWHTVVY